MTMQTLFTAILRIQDAKPARKQPRCKWCFDSGELGSGAPCNHCNYGCDSGTAGPEPEWQEDDAAETARLQVIEREYRR